MAAKWQILSMGDCSSSSGMQRWDGAKFISEEVWKRYKQSFSKRNLVPEHDFWPDQTKDCELMAMIIECKWVHFTKSPESDVVSVVCEFYANASADGPTVVQVRGRFVAYESQSINALFATLSYDGKDYLEPGLRCYDLDDIIKRLCKPGTTWKTNDTTGEKTSFLQHALSRYGKA